MGAIWWKESLQLYSHITMTFPSFDRKALGTPGLSCRAQARGYTHRGPASGPPRRSLPLRLTHYTPLVD